MRGGDPVTPPPRVHTGMGLPGSLGYTQKTSGLTVPVVSPIVLNTTVIIVLKQKYISYVTFFLLQYIIYFSTTF